jgi:2-dehydro-3-deoxygluconokinase
MTPDDIPADYLKGARILHTSGISLAISSSAADTVFTAMRIARGAGVDVSLDTNLRLRLWPLDRARAIVHAAAGLTDLLRPSIDDARQLTGLTDPDKIVDFYLGLGPKVVALTLGEDGALIATAGKRERIPSRRAKLVDATGAGDMFDGAFLAEYLRTGDPFAAGRYANVAAALSTEGYGAVAPMPRRAAVEAAIAAG